MYQNLLKFLGDYGATVRDLRYDASTLTEAHVSCFLSNLNTDIRFRLERFEVTFSRYYEIGDEAAMRIGLSAWAALQASAPSIKLVRHELFSDFHADVVKGTSKDVIQRYVTSPESFGDKTTSTVFFQLQGRGEGEENDNIYVSPSILKEGALFLRFHMVYDATQIPLEKLRERADKSIMTRLQQMGLEIEQPS